MKKTIAVILSLILIAALFTGCARSADIAKDAGYAYAGSSTGSSMYAPAPAEMPEAEDYYDGYYESTTADASSAAFGNTSAMVKTVSLSEKIIYSAYCQLETVKFEDSVQGVYDLLDRCGGFIESSNVSGVDYSTEFYSYQTYRNANFVVRVPVAAFASFTDSLDSLGNVTYVSTNADNITAQFYDTQSRLDAYKTEESRLLQLLEKAETVEDMITIEDRLSWIRYEMESLKTTLNNWQNEVDYSTVTIEIQEVKELTEIHETQRTYWQEVGDGIKSTLKGIGRFFTDLFKGIVIALPVIILLLVIFLVIFFIVRACIRKNRKKNAAKRAQFAAMQANTAPQTVQTEEKKE